MNTRHLYQATAGEADGGGGGEDTATATEPTEVSAEVIAKAEKMGWTPKSEFKGDPAKWRPADEFVERGENMLPIVRASVKRLERDNAELKATMREMGEHFTKAEQRAYDKALTDLKAQRAQAVKDGDGEAFTQVDEAIDSLKQDIQTKAKPRQAEDSDFVEWKEKSTWLSDPEKEAYATAIANFLRIKGDPAVGKDFLEKVTKEVKARFPESFENHRRREAPSVEGGGSPPRTGGKGYADLPADARAACDRMAKNAFSDQPEKMKKFKADYVKNYFDDV